MKGRGWLVIYTAVHFLVDLSCIYFLTGMMIPRFADHEKWLLLAVFYNMLAFALPMVLGLLADSWKRNAWTAAAGCLCAALGYGLWKFPYPAVALLGIGNGLFHIGGGRQVLSDSGKRYAPCGIFISSGALGVYFGHLWGSAYYPLWKLFSAVLLFCAAVLWLLRKREAAEPADESGNSGHSGRIHTGQKRRAFSGIYVGAVLSLLIVVCIRSLYGTLLNYSWKTGMWMGLIFTLCIAGGKMSGGILADWLGVLPATLISLGTAAVLAVFSFFSPVCGCISVYFFNMTMPLTLSLLVRLMPENPGFAFGMLMFGLFLGTLPVMLWNDSRLFTPMGLFCLCLLSLLMLLWEIRTERKCV